MLLLASGVLPLCERWLCACDYGRLGFGDENLGRGDLMDVLNSGSMWSAIKTAGSISRAHGCIKRRCSMARSSGAAAAAAAGKATGGGGR